MIILLFGVRYGINGVAVSILIYSVAIAFIVLYYVSKLLGTKPIKLCIIILRYSFMYFSLSGAVWLASRMLTQKYYDISPLSHLAFNAGLCIVVYLFLLIIFVRNDLYMLFGLVNKVLGLKYNEKKNTYSN